MALFVCSNRTALDACLARTEHFAATRRHGQPAVTLVDADGAAHHPSKPAAPSYTWTDAAAQREIGPAPYVVVAVDAQVQAPPARQQLVELLLGLISQGKDIVLTPPAVDLASMAGSERAAPGLLPATWLTCEPGSRGVWTSSALRQQHVHRLLFLAGTVWIVYDPQAHRLHVHGPDQVLAALLPETASAEPTPLILHILCDGMSLAW